MISNTSPLIFLAKIEQLSLLKKLFSKVIIPNAVKEEVLIEGKEESETIKKVLSEGWLQIENPKQELNFSLSKGENSAISLAKEKNGTLIIDDAVAIKVANSFNIKTIRTTTIIFLALKKKTLTKKQALALLDKLIKEGYYISPKYYIELFRKLSS